MASSASQSVTSAQSSAPRVLLLGWDGADWKIIHELIDRGEMPHLAGLIERGCMGNLASGRPMLSPMLWTTIATGQLPDRHGIFGFTEPRPDGSGVRPVTSTSVQAPTLWEIAEAAGLPSSVVGWFATYPADRFPGIVVSDMFANASGKHFDEWPVPARAVSPPSLQQTFRDLRIHPADITLDEVAPFVPDVQSVDQSADERPGAIANYLARCATVHACATHSVENEPWRLAAVYFETIDRLCHWFMETRPPRLDWVPEEDVSRYGGVVDQAYRFHDLMLGRYLQLVDDQTTVVICSDHGFHSDHLRPSVSAHMKDGNPLQWHRQQGVFIAAGPGVKQDETVFGATITDIAPTILELLGLPPSTEMEGRVLRQIFTTPPALERISRATLIPSSVDEEEEKDPWAAEEALRQLVELGYIEKPSDDAEEAIRKTRIQMHLNLSEVLRSKRRLAAAIVELDHVLVLDGQNRRASIDRIESLFELNRFDEARADIARLESEEPQPWLDMLRGELAMRTGDLDGAIAALNQAARGGWGGRGLYVRIARVYSRQGLWLEAEKQYREALSIDPDYPAAMAGLGHALYKQERAQEAIEYLLQAIGLQYAQPIAHFHLGLALAATGRLRNAVEALQNALRQRPGFRPARRALAYLKPRVELEVAAQVSEALDMDDHRYQGDVARNAPARVGGGEKLGLVDSAAEALTDDIDVLPYNADNDIVVVSGLPRSGTSMMMQMLEAGGLPLFTDDVRTADESNPLGYFEHEAVKATGRDASWVLQAHGKGVKVISRLLTHLPVNKRYFVIFMGRPLTEVLRSQARMIGQVDEARTRALEQQFQREVNASISWLREASHVEPLFVNFADVITDPLRQAGRVCEFLDLPLDHDAMAAVVDPGLYRQRVP